MKETHIIVITMLMIHVMKSYHYPQNTVKQFHILSDRVSALLIQELPVTIVPSKPHKIETTENSDEDMWSDKNLKIQYARILADRAEQERIRNLTPQQKKDMIKNAKRDAYNQANGIVTETVSVDDAKKKRSAKKVFSYSTYTKF